MKCRIYRRRPLVCRIYPAEINPFIQLDPTTKSCPPEAWTSSKLLVLDNRVVDPEVQSLIERSRQTDENDVPRKERLSALLGINVAALAGDGFVIYNPDASTLLAALRSVRDGTLNGKPSQQPWRLHSSSPATTEMLRAAGADVVTKASEHLYSFVPLSPNRTTAIPHQTGIVALEAAL
jgi:hypothetical protein